MKIASKALVITCVLVVTTAFAGRLAQGADVLLVVDSSASMSKSTPDGIRRIDAAKQALQNILPNLRNDQVGLMLFGHRVPANQRGCCDDIEIEFPFGPLSESRFTEAVSRLQPKGNTPLTRSLHQARDVLINREKDVQKAVIVLTDGNETCNGDPVAAAKQLRDMGINAKIHIVGFAVQPKEEAQLKEIAQAGGGQYVLAEDAATLNKVLPQVIEASVVKTTIIEQPPIAGGFIDNFDGESLSEEWSVINPDEEGYIVDEGHLLVVSSAVASLADANVPNMFRLNKQMPRGNWQMTMKVDGDFHTRTEAFAFGLYDDPKNYVLTELHTHEWGGYTYLQLHAVKAVKGKVSRFKKSLKHWKTADATAARVPLMVRIQKRGRSYYSAAKLVTPTGTGEWVEMEKVTSIRANGNLAMGLYQYKKTAGETTMNVDWVKIEPAN